MNSNFAMCKIHNKTQCWKFYASPFYTFHVICTKKWPERAKRGVSGDLQRYEKTMKCSRCMNFTA